MEEELLQRLKPLAEKYANVQNGTIVGELGAGGSAAVYVVRTPQRNYALKVYDPRFLQGKNGAAERKRIELQRGLINHTCEFLIQLHDVSIDDSGCYVEMDWMPWQTMKQVLPSVPNESVGMLLSQLVHAARFLDGVGIVHRDIKPENILVSPNFSQLRLIDLGVVRESDGTDDAADATDQGQRRPFVATAQYSSPEYLFRLQEPSADMWRALTFYQIGAVLHDMLSKRPLFDGAARTENKHVISMAVFRDTPAFGDIPKNLASLAALATHCLTKDPELRLRLVSWERFEAPSLTGSSRLQAMERQAEAAANARRLLEQNRATLQQEREQYIKQFMETLRIALLQHGSQAFKTAAYTRKTEAAHFDFRMPRGAVLHFQFTFEWQSELLPYRATVTLQGRLNAAPTPASSRSAAVGEADTKVAVDSLVEAALDRLGVAVSSANDQMTSGQMSQDGSGTGDLIEATGLG